MSSQKIHTFSETGLHSALLIALLLILLVGLLDSLFFTPEGATPVMWRLEPVVVTGQAQPSH
ncbi:hypothetical protein [Paucibacter sp. Y2R2-4]|uniref:hypothetical protein n=1 Tax=Paucibacter sp. Y2R2-4 TaxID=2893553 RepID=UPI0021E4FE32|nr:hypothetical protein [Paucibacter sp. Y2R2-4]MCV2351998.1 hypothetical protein [Paucibacter sp. Y2R2-4]